MKLVIVLFVFACTNAAKLNRNYLPPTDAKSSGGSGNILQTPFLPKNFGADSGFEQSRNDFPSSGNFNYQQNVNGFARSDDVILDNGNFAGGMDSFQQTRPERPQSAFERNAHILRLDNQNDGKTYNYAYETENGIYAEESGSAENGVEAQGGYTYTGDDGQVYSIRYTAGQNGFVPVGDHLPTPPPIPEEILKALEQNARDEAAGIYDDGSYAEEKYFDSNNGYNNNGVGFSNSENGLNNQNFLSGPTSFDDSIVTNAARFIPESGTNFRNRDGVAATGFQTTNLASHSTGANKAYLPPTENRRSFYNALSERSSFGRKPSSFDSRTGYQY